MKIMLENTSAIVCEHVYILKSKKGNFLTEIYYKVEYNLLLIRN